MIAASKVSDAQDNVSIVTCVNPLDDDLICEENSCYGRGSVPSMTTVFMEWSFGMNQVILRVGDELIVPGFPLHKMVYVGPIGPYGEDVVNPAKGRAAQFVHFDLIPNKE